MLLAVAEQLRLQNLGFVVTLPQLMHWFTFSLQGNSEPSHSRSHGIVALPVPNVEWKV